MKWYVTAVIFSFLCSCTNETDIPVAVIRPKKMQELIWDMVKADAFADVLRVKDTLNTLPKISMHLTDEVLALHNTNRLQVEKSFDFYSAHPGILKIMLDSISAQQSRAPVYEKLVKPGKTSHQNKWNE